MKINDWLSQSESKLSAVGIKTARLDSLVLLEFVLNVDRAKILAEPEAEIPDQKLQQLTNLLNRRAKKEPIAYLRGFSEFYGREFKIDQNVLVPRPESEAFIELLIADVLPEFQNKSTVKIIDVGAGSGALGISAHLEANKLQKTQVDLLELDQNASKVAKSNVVLHATGQKVFVGPLERFDYSNYDIVMANLPYAPDNSQINPDATHEPSIAIFGGRTGLELYSEMLKSIQSSQKRPLYLLLECLQEQLEDLESLCEDFSYNSVKTDLLVTLFTLTKPE